ncbi:MAG: hypothetical protein M3Q73_04275, partial [bacterium]|nr:hypothetical protein [bacterium]
MLRNCLIENLETRQLMSGSRQFFDGWLFVNGTAGNDTYVVTATGHVGAPMSNGTASVTLTHNGETSVTHDVTHLIIWDDFGGNDTFRVENSDTMSDVQVPISLHGGDGRD